MPIQIRASKTNKNEEKKILIASIVSTQFLKETSFLRPEIFVIPYAKRIFRWVDSYFKKYDEAPQKTIKDIFNAERNKIDEDEAELIADFLESISSQYANEEDKEIFNSKYAIDNARKYAKQRELELKISEVNGLLSMGHVEEAESSLLNYKKTAFNTSSWLSPLSEEEITKTFDNEGESKLFRLPGDLGEILGDHSRGCLYCVQAKMKTGKSWMLGEFRTQALLSGLKVAEFNFEMVEAQVKKRFYKRITAATETGGDSIYPVSDCVLNQNGKCKDPRRKNKITLYSHQDYIPEFGKHDENYRVCDICRGKSENYQFASWFHKISREEFTKEFTIKRGSGFVKMWGDNYRLRVYPRFSAGVDEMIRDLDFLESTEDWVPDVIIADYAKLMKTRTSHKEDRHRISEVFMTLGGLGAEKNCAVFTAAQTNREGSKKVRGDVTDIGDDYSIPANCDALYILNQTEQEKTRGIIRVGVGAMRDGKFSKDKDVLILSDLSAGQFLLDSNFES